MRTKLPFILLSLFLCTKVNGQEAEKVQSANALRSLYMEGTSDIPLRMKAREISASNNAYGLMALREYLGTINLMIDKMDDPELIVEQIKLVDNLTKSAQTSRRIRHNAYVGKDRYKGWVVTEANKANETTIGKEVPLFESYSFFYVAQFLYLLKEKGWVNQSFRNNLWWRKNVRFLEKNVWKKWQERSFKEYGVNNRYFLRNRTHMGSHWAGIAMYLNAITDNYEIKRQTKEVKEQYDLLLKRNLKVVGDAYLWNSTYDNPKGTDATSPKEAMVQDVPHSNHIVSYIIAAYEFGDPNWTEKDITLLANTFKNVLYNPNSNRLSDLINGQMEKGRLNWEANISDGWMKLMLYDSDISRIFQRFYIENKLRKGVQEWTYDILMSVNEDSSHY